MTEPAIHPDDLAKMAAQVADDSIVKVEAYGLALVALAFCCSEEAWPRFRRWLLEEKGTLSVQDPMDFAGRQCSGQQLYAASLAFSSWLVLNGTRIIDASRTEGS